MIYRKDDAPTIEEARQAFDGLRRGTIPVLEAREIILEAVEHHKGGFAILDRMGTMRAPEMKKQFEAAVCGGYINEATVRLDEFQQGNVSDNPHTSLLIIETKLRQASRLTDSLGALKESSEKQIEEMRGTVQELNKQQAARASKAGGKRANGTNGKGSNDSQRGV